MLKLISQNSECQEHLGVTSISNTIDDDFNVLRKPKVQKSGIDGSTAQSAEAELESYLCDGSASPDGRWNPLEFWEVKERSEQFKYQRLCRLAKRVLYATVTTAGV